MLAIRHFSKSYKGDKKAVDDLSLEVEGGDIYGFIGHNGAGKTTTLRCIAGALDFAEGEIIVDGISIKDDPVRVKRSIAYLPDNPDLYEHLTGIAYLQFIADVFAVSKSDRDDLIKRYADEFELTADLGSPISAFSHGMKQKLALISAFIHRPKLLVLDEPFVGLDPKASFAVKSVMKQMCDEGGAVFFSTHVLEVAQKLCNKVAIIKQGKLVANGLVDDVIGDKDLESVFLEIN